MTGDSLKKYVHKFPEGNNYKLFTLEVLIATNYIEVNNYIPGIIIVNTLVGKKSI
ncbi:hypothetical protein [Galbibacter pacificus]|uniref:hypothetical protein n=1 Tax=Galbibacter pacificus TaxID=2996052 RepID=UPI002412A43D|nr:hypothetical protein [Galbibacter pacificus]MDG3583960.1 hypothetical protein [Galbibacter pacificus]